MATQSNSRLLGQKNTRNTQPKPLEDGKLKEAQVWRFESELELKNQKISSLEQRVIELELAVENKTLQAREYEQWVVTLSNSALIATSSQKDSNDFQHQLNIGLKRVDQLLKDNFELKRSLAFEKKKYLDLMNAFLEMRQQMNNAHSLKANLNTSPNPSQNVNVEALIQEKVQLTQTVQTMSQEVELLSKKNEEFLEQLKMKEFYQPYKASMEELQKLRQAHAILIGMIQNQQLSVTSPFKQGSMFSPQSNKSAVSWQGPPNSKIQRKSDNSHPNDRNKHSTHYSKRVNLSGPSSNFSDFLSCGSLLGSKNHPKTSMQEEGQFSAMGFNDREIYENEYLQIVRDPQFMQEANLNFLGI